MIKKIRLHVACSSNSVVSGPHVSIWACIFEAEKELWIQDSKMSIFYYETVSLTMCVCVNTTLETGQVCRSCLTLPDFICTKFSSLVLIYSSPHPFIYSPTREVPLLGTAPDRE